MLTFDRIWNLLCSLKLAIVLASAATLITMAGSVLIPFRPTIFGGMDSMLFGQWLSAFGSAHAAAWWVWAAAILLFLLGVNTLCCLIDWLLNIGSRWRKSGEYLIHLGFVLLVAAYAIGSLSGFRSEGNRLLVGETAPVPNRPGLYLRLNQFEPLFSESGGFLDMRSDLTLLHGDRELQRQTVSINHPLLAEGMVIIGSTFGRQAEGFLFHLEGRGQVSLSPDSSLPLPGGKTLRVLKFYPHAARTPGGQARRLSGELQDPALLLELRGGGSSWRGWYFLRRGLPEPLTKAGIGLRPLSPVYRPYSVLTINHDPGAKMALVGAISMTIGVLLAVFSYYRKRNRQDRPQVG